MKRANLFAAVLVIVPAFAAVDVKQGQDRIDVTIDGQPFTTFYFGENTMKPYLSPLRTATGAVVTRLGPMEKVAGESTDHPHHQGLWFTHGDVNGLDFWANVKPGPKFGRVVVDKITTAKSGAKSGEIAFEARWVGPDEKPVLRENRRMIFSGDAQNRIIDLDITLTAVDKPVKFGDTKEGTMAIRLSDKLTENRGGSGTMRNAEGAQKMNAVWGKPSVWVDYSGTLDGQPVGVAMFDHSKNPKHPTTWHSRDYGLFAANPFGDHDFYNDKSKDGSLTVQPGKSLRFRYRVVIHPGDTSAAKIADLYKDWK